MEDVTALLVTASLRVGGICAAAWLVTVALRRGSAAARHMVWTSAIAAALLTPILVPLSMWRIPLPSVLAAPTPPLPEAPGIAAAAPARPAPIVEFRVAPADPIARPKAVAPSVVTPIAIVMLIWAAGCGLVLLWIVNGAIATARLRRTATPPDADWIADASAIAVEVGIGRVTFVESADSTMPFVCGVIRPLVVMPAEASAWTADRRRAVLLHELAHVRRHDCLTQLLARIACAIYWFHPLVWLAAHRLRVERERACDDVVLTSGVLGSAYGRHLVDIAKAAVSRRSGFAAGGVAMAHRRRLEERLVSILDPQVLRTTSQSSRLVVTAFGLLAIGAASLQVQAQVPALPPAVAQPRLTAETRLTVTPTPTPPPVAQTPPAAAQAPPAAAPTPPPAAQAPTSDVTFEVVSIKRNKEVEAQRLATPPNVPFVPGRAQTRPGGVVMGRGMTVREFIRDAYGYRNRAHSDIVGGPGWLDSERYDIQAKVSDGRDLGASSSMGLPPAAEAAMQAMLAERMKLRIRRESPVRPVYELVMHREDRRFGPNLTVSKGGCVPFFQREAMGAATRLVFDPPKEGEPPPLRPCPLMIGVGMMGSENMTMAEWAQLLALAPQLNRTVIDRTDLPGRYDIMLRDPDPGRPGAADLLPAMKPALERMLGLTLREAEAPVEILVIESVERPTEN